MADSAHFRSQNLITLHWVIESTLHRLENILDFTVPEEVLRLSDDLGVIEHLGIKELPWIEDGTDRPGYTRLTCCYPVTGKFLTVYLGRPVANSEPAELTKFTNLLRIWLRYVEGLQASIADDTDEQPAPAAAEQITEPGYTIAAALDLTHMSNGTLNKYARLAGVPTPKRGGRNHVFSKSQLCAILDKAIAVTSEKKRRSAYQEALESLR